MSEDDKKGDKKWGSKFLPNMAAIKSVSAFLFAVATGVIIISGTIFSVRELIDDVKHQETRLFVQNQLAQQRLEIKGDLMEAVNVIKNEVSDKVSKTELENAILTQTLHQTLYTKDEIDNVRLEMRERLRDVINERKL
ncbi:hypothetical protein VmeM32_00015 [Vibrio phage vB_VmeM-32]|nr:hypothetical protein VmeM32_00015 [Vibrio phage vB_VmeM-32]